MKIGEPSVKAILKRLDREYDEDLTITLLAVVVLNLEGRETGRALLQKKLEEAPTGTWENTNIRNMLKVFE